MNHAAKHESMGEPSDVARSVADTIVAGDESADGAETCPVIYADRVYLGLAGPRRLRVVCFSADDRRTYINSAA